MALSSCGDPKEEAQQLLQSNGITLSTLEINSNPGISLFREAVKQEHWDIVQAFITLGFDSYTAWECAKDCTTLYRNADFTKQMLKAGADVNAKDKNGWTPLMVASQEDLSGYANFLVQSGADPNVKDNRGRTALMIAAQHENALSMEVLIKAGADLNAKDSIGRTALMIAAQKNHRLCGGILQRAGADLNAQDIGGQTALMLSGHEGFMDFLVRAGADVNVRDKGNMTVMDYAKARGYTKVVQLLQTAKNSR